MASRYQQLLNQYAGAMPTPLPVQKAEEVEQAADSKRQMLEGLTPQDGYDAATIRHDPNMAGLSSASEIERDMATASPLDLYLKYGDAARGMIANRSTGSIQRQADITNTDSNRIGDMITSILTGTTNLVGGVAGLGAGALSPVIGAKPGHAINEVTGDVTGFIKGFQSEAVNASDRVYDAARRMAERDNRETANGIANDLRPYVGDTVAEASAGVAEGVADTYSALKNSWENPTMALNTTGEAIGSLLPIGKLTKVLGKVGGAVVRRVGMAGAVEEIAAAKTAGRYLTVGDRIALSATEHAPVMAAIGLSEAGGSFQGTEQEAYRQLKEQGVDEGDALRIANNAGLSAAWKQGLAAMASGALTAKFEANPFAKMSPREFAKILLKEPIEEGFQGASGQLAQNLAVQDYVNADQRLMEGVGEQVGLGIVGALGSTGAVQTPGLALRGAIETAKLPFRAAGAVLTYQGNRVAARNQKVQDDALRGIFGEADAVLPDAQSEAEQAIEAAKANATVKAAAREWVNGMVERFQQTKSVQAAADIVNKVGGATKDKLDAALEVINGIRNSETTQDDETPAPLANTTMQSIKDAVANVAQSEGVQQAMDNAKTMFGRAAGAINAGVRSAIAGQQARKASAPEDMQVAANRLVGLAETNPEKLDPDAANQILYHAGQGTIQLTPVQTNALRMGVAAARTAKDATNVGSKYGLTGAQAVAENVLTNGRKKGERLSLQEHLKTIRAALDMGDREAATRAFRELSGFAQHLSNQVVAINDALVGGNTNDKNPVTFNAHVGNGVFKPLGSRYVQPTSEKSVKIAQEMATQAAVVGAAVNNLSDAFPEFSIPHIEISSLDPLLDGDATTVAKEYASGKRKASVNEADSITVEAGQVDQGKTPYEMQVVEEPNVDQTNSEQAVFEPTQKVEQSQTEVVVSEAEKVSAVEEKTLITEATLVDQPGEQGIESSVTDKPVSEQVPAEEVQKDQRVGGDSNRVTRAFTEPNKPKTRIAESVSPLQDVKDALSSETALREKLGEIELNRRFTQEIADQYRELLAAGERIIQVMTARMQKAVKSKLGRLSFEELLPKLEAGALNAVIQDANGNYIYDPKIVESAVLAGLQWVLKMNSHGVTMTDEAVREAFGLTSDAYIPDGLADRLSAGLSTAEVSRSLAQAIGQFLGLKERTDIPVNEAQAVKEGLAKEVLTALINQGLVDEFKVDISEISTRDNVSDVVRFRPGVMREADAIDESGNVRRGNVVRDEQGNRIRAIAPDAAIRGFPDAIEKAVLTDTQPESFVGEMPTEVAKTQLRSDTPVTKEQQEVIKAEQAIEHNVNLPFINLLISAGQESEELVLRLFAGQIDDTMNENHKRSVEGRRLMFQSAFRSIQNLMAEVTNVASKSGRDLGTVPVYFRYAYTVVNRLQMLGKNNPQFSKLMREFILPTWDVLDLTDSQNRLKFSLGLAQALGVKVHKVQPKVMLVELKDALAKFPKTLEMLGNSSFKLTEAAVDTMIEEGVESPVMLHALMEYARLQKPETDKSKFKTALYFEADGVTNGVVNAMSLFSSGSFTPNWVSNIQRGGLWIGEQALSLAHIRQTDTDAQDDLYGKAAENTAYNVRKLIQRHEGKDTGEVMLSVLHVLTTLLPKGIQYDEKSNKLKLDRAATKNPLTITVYGSGVMGIAGNILDEALNAMYERFSQAAARKKADPSISDGQAFFGGDRATADKKWNRFTKAMRVLGANKLVKEENNLYVAETGIDRILSGSNFTDYTVDKVAKRALQESFLHAFVNPMVRGITKTVGSDLIGTMDLIKRQTQTWSLVGQFMYQNAYEKALKAKRAANPDMDSYELLSKDEEDFIRKQIDQNLPQFSTGTQNYTFGQQQRLNFPFMTSKNGKPLGLEFSRALDDRFETPAYGYMPGDAGVSGQPNMTIGNGDGQAVQNIIKNPETPKKRLQIFDGIHSTIAELDKMGLAANKGVFDSWQRNPMADLAKAFRNFADQVDLSSLTEDQLKALAKSVFGGWTAVPAASDLELTIKTMAISGQEVANNIAARQRVLASVQHSVDQMAGAAAPYSNPGLILSGSAAAKAAQLNKLLAVEKAKNEPVRAFEAPTQSVTPDSTETSVKASESNSETKAQKPSFTQMNMFSALGAPVTLFGRALEKVIAKVSDNLLTRALLRDVVRSDKLKDYTVYTGSREALINRAADMGIIIPADRQDTFNGMIHPESRQMFVLNGDAETMLHESIHAVTYETVAAHYRGENVGPEAKAAITRLEGLMGEFRKIGNINIGFGSIGNPEDIMNKGTKEEYVSAFGQDIFDRIEAGEITEEIINKVQKGIDLLESKQLKERFNSYGISDKVYFRIVDSLSKYAVALGGSTIDTVNGAYLYPNKDTKGFGAKKPLLLIARDMMEDPEKVIDHETIHAFRQLGMFTVEEWNTLVTEALSNKSLKKSVDTRYIGLSKTARNEEAVADLFAMWRQNNSVVSEKNNSIFKKLLLMIGSVFSAFKNQQNLSGSVEEIFKKIVNGSLAKRGPQQSAVSGLLGSASIAQSSFDVAYQNSLAEMNRHFMNDDKAAELNEFMAWSLSNVALRDKLQTIKITDKSLSIPRKVVQTIKALLWGGKRSAAVRDDLFTNIRFNTAIIMRSNPTPSEMTSSATLYHDPSFGNDQRLIKLLESVKGKIADYITEDVINRVNLARRAGLEPAKETDAAKGFEKDTRGKVDRGRIQGASAAIAFDRVGFDFTMQERMAFVMMVSVMATAADLDANATSRMQEIYTHVVSNLSVDDFLRDPTTNNPEDNEQANKKFNLLTGGFANRTDNRDRSLIMPAFVALAATNPEFRAIINKMPMPKGKYVGWNSVDNILDNIGDMGMDAVSRVVSGEGALTKNVQDSIDNLVSQMLETNAEAEMFIEKYTKPVGSAIDQVNEKLVSLFNWLGEKAEANLEKAKTDPDAKIKLALASSLKTLTGILHEPTGQGTAMKVMSTANQSEGLWKPFYDLLKDLVGRTVENARVYDLIKLARYHVSSLRQQFVEELPKIINSKFSRDLTEVEQTAMFKGLAQTDLASLLGDNTIQEILKWVFNPAARDIKIKELSDTISDLSPENAALILSKSEQLAEYMINKKSGSSLLRNADAIAHLLNEGKPSPVTSKEMVKAIDHLVSLKALSKISSRDSIALSSLVLSEKEGLNFVLNSLRGQRETEQSKADGNARFNHYKGHMTSMPGDSVSLIVAHDNETAKLLEKSYIRLGPLVGSPRDPSAKNRSYFYAPVSGRAAYSQGIAQNVQRTVSGVDHATGFTLGTTGGIITDPKFVAKIRQNKAVEKVGSALLPVFDAKGKLYAYERQVAPAMLDRLQGDTNLAKMMGARGGRQAEEAAAMTINRLLIDNLRDMWDRDRRAGKQNEYQDLFKSTDPVVQDSVSILSNEMKMYITARFPEGFMVRSDMVDDAIGYRAASIGDVWTGTSRWSEQTQEMVKKAMMGMFGNKAYAYAVKAEKFWQNAIVQDIRTMIIIRSVIVPMANAASNVYQLIGRGVPMTSIFRGIPKKTAEIESWHKTRIRQMEAEAELLATTDLVQRRKLEVEIKAISDSHKRLTIWPLLERGEFSSISDAGSREDVLLTQGKLSDFIEAQIDKLPSAVRTAGKYAIISKDTALFRALQKTVDYGDFVAKAILYDDLTKRQHKTKEEALARITEEFVNYDRLPGRDRQYLESVGLLWFWNFKVRSSKVALSMLRNNPVHAIIAANMPLPINGIGLPLEDNLWSSLFDGRLFNSFGLHTGFRAPGLLPLGGLLN